MMNKFLAACLGLSILFLYAEAEANTISYWQKYAQEKYPQYNYSRYLRPTFRSRTNRTTSTRPTTTTRTTSTNRTTGNYYQRNPYRYQPYRRSTSNTSSSTSNRYNYSGYTPTRYNASTSSQISASGLVASVIPKPQSHSFFDITSAPVDIFSIGLRNSESSGGNTFKEAINVNELKFQIVDNQGLSSNLSLFELLIDGQSFRFTQNGFVTLKAGDLRLAAGESVELPVKIRVEDPSIFPRVSGSFRVKLTEIRAEREISQAAVPVRINGRTTSDYIALSPSSGTSSGSGEAEFTSQTVFGRSLAAGEKAFVLTTNLYASRDDFILEDLTVRNTYGNNVDSLISEVNLWDLSSNRKLDSRKFLNGQAHFRLSGSDRLVIPRNGRISLGIEVVVKSYLPSNVTDNRLSIDINSSDVVLYSYATGRPVSDGSKNIDFNPQTFTVTQGGLPSNGGISFSSSQPELVPTGGLTEVARFKIGNSGGGNFSIGRISLETVLNGLEFPGGLSTDDAELRFFHNGTAISNNIFTVTSASGNKIVFDANSEIYVDRGQQREFALLLKVKNSGSTDENDSVSVRILGDSGNAKGSLSAIRAGNYNFIWSDHSGHPHTTSSNDWLSGYLLGGLPSSFYVNRRD